MDSNPISPSAERGGNPRRKSPARGTAVRTAVDLALFVPLTASILIGLVIVDLLAILRSAIRPLALCSHGSHRELPAPEGIERRLEPAHLPRPR